MKLNRSTYDEMMQVITNIANAVLCEGTGNLLELFAGSRSVGKVGEELGMKVFSVDWQMFEDIDLAILQPRSPTCGSGKIYDGTFSGKLIDGDGIFVQELKQRGIKVLSPEEI